MPRRTLQDYLPPAYSWEELQERIRAPQEAAGTSPPPPAQAVPGGSAPPVLSEASLVDAFTREVQAQAERVRRDMEREIPSLQAEWARRPRYVSSHKKAETVYQEMPANEELGILPKDGLELPPIDDKVAVFLQFPEGTHIRCLIVPGNEAIGTVKFMTVYNTYGYICKCKLCMVRWFLKKEDLADYNVMWSQRNGFQELELDHLGACTHKGWARRMAVLRLPPEGSSRNF